MSSISLVMITICEMKFGDDWRPVTIVDAPDSIAGNPMRCPACHGPVSPYKAGNWHFGHLKAHNGCELAWNYIGIEIRDPAQGPRSCQIRATLDMSEL